MIKGKFSHLITYKADIIAVFILFIVALALRLLFQAESHINNPFVRDAREYAVIAYNLYNDGVYTNIAATKEVPAVTNIARPPGYPLFLYLFMAKGRTIDQFFHMVIFAQAIMSSISVVLTFILGRLFLNRLWSFGAGMFTALSPHLVAMDYFILSESLFIFILLLGAIGFSVAWLKQKHSIFLITGMLFGVSALTKPIAILLGPFIALLFLVISKNPKISIKTISIQFACLVLGCVLTYGPLIIARNMGTEPVSVSSQSIWDKIVIGADIDMKNFILNKVDPEKIKQAQRMHQDKEYGIKILTERFKNDPINHLRWYLGGKLFYLWSWDSIYTGDVYQYALTKKGFDINPILKEIHTIMRILHWPLFLLSLASPMLLLFFLYRDGSSVNNNMVLVPLLLFFYFAILMTILHPLPRYGIPLRPFSYLLACYTLSQIRFTRIS